MSWVWNGDLSTTNSSVFGTGSGTQITFNVTENMSSGETKISSSLYFKFVKSKLKKTEKERLRKSAVKLQHLIKNAKEINQTAYAEELSRKLYTIVKAMEAQAIGCDKIVSTDDVEKFRHNVNGREVDFVKFENFPRTIPANISRKIKAIQEKAVFDEYWVLFYNPKKESIKTNAQKEKDPILFGKFNFDNKKLFYILDWEDEYCDLTLDKFVDELQKVDKEYVPSRLPDLDDKFVSAVVREVKDHHDRMSRVPVSMEQKKGLLERMWTWIKNLKRSL